MQYSPAFVRFLVIFVTSKNALYTQFLNVRKNGLRSKKPRSDFRPAADRPTAVVKTWVDALPCSFKGLPKTNEDVKRKMKSQIK